MLGLLNIPNTDIQYRKWTAPENKAILLLVHGIGAHSERWKFLAEYFLKQNISSYAIELKGFGETATPKGHINSFRIYYEDIQALQGLIREEDPGRKVYLVGESMGGLIAFLLAAQAPRFFDGAVCISPAFRNKLKFPLKDYLTMFWSLLVRPEREFALPFDAAMCTQDLAYQKMMDNDPRELRTATARLLGEILFAQLKAQRLASELNVPILFLLSGRDELVRPEASRRIFGKLAVKDKKIIEYSDMKHALSIELGREKVFADIWEWLSRRF